MLLFGVSKQGAETILKYMHFFFMIHGAGITDHGRKNICQYAIDNYIENMYDSFLGSGKNLTEILLSQLTQFKKFLKNINIAV